jgi:hypothetical protein
MSLTVSGLLLLLSVVRPLPADDPEPPALGKKAMECQAPIESPSTDHLVLRCVTRAKLPVAAVLLHYRQSGSEDFTAAPTLRSRKGWYTATLCPHTFEAGPLHYYFEALDMNGKVVASVGDDESPGVVRILGPLVAGKGHGAGAPARNGAAGDDDPLAPLRASIEASRADERARQHRRPGSYFLGIGAGVGYGWYPARVLEFRKDASVNPGGGVAGPLVLTPEVGYQLSSRVAVSLLARWELIGSSGSGDLHAGAPATSAFALLGRGSYYWGSGRLQLVASGMLGAGEGVRVVVPPTAGNDVTIDRNDTVLGGPVLLGPGVGFTYHLGPHFAWIGELRALAGVPNFAAVVDVNTGVQFGF